MSARVPAILRSTMPPGVVTFDINPDSVRMSRSANVTSRASASPNSGAPAGASGSIFRRAAAAQIILSNVIFYGPDTKPRCDQLLNWMTPGGGLLGAIAGAALSAATGGAVNLAARLPLVTFQWGPPAVGFMYDVNVTACSVNYTRFAPSGIPVRAEVGMTLQQQPSLLGVLSTNPTSGGLPGRRAHTVTDGESLAAIATSRYGTPAAWRQIAACNGIEDPLRVRAGDRVYLPNPDEFGGERR
ncbi:LysM peptidoglycan-binding domain-containing protein [Planosporangium sp. 12N6]|uniref:LysM peptidoglycan-binding domain-containing protein n=1 Tax=Planosporangium spinosum TaxID=3402278 RepID=UPI003CEEAEEF